MCPSLSLGQICNTRSVFPPVEQTINPLKNHTVTLIALLILLHLWAYLDMLFIIEVHRIHSRWDCWWLLCPSSLHYTFQYYDSWLQEENILVGADFTFLCVMFNVCSIFNNRVLPSGSCGKSRAVTIVCNVWGIPGTALTNNLGGGIAHLALVPFYLATYVFWEEHYPLCRVTPIKFIHIMYSSICMKTIIYVISTGLFKHP